MQVHADLDVIQDEEIQVEIEDAFHMRRANKRWFASTCLHQCCHKDYDEFVSVK